MTNNDEWWIQKFSNCFNFFCFVPSTWKSHIIWIRYARLRLDLEIFWTKCSFIDIINFFVVSRFREQEISYFTNSFRNYLLHPAVLFLPFHNWVLRHNLNDGQHSVVDERHERHAGLARQWIRNSTTGRISFLFCTGEVKIVAKYFRMAALCNVTMLLYFVGHQSVCMAPSLS